MATETGMTPRHATVDSNDPEVIEEQIEQTRAEMSATIDAIQAKLDPERLKAQAMESIREAAEQAKEEAVHTARDAAQHAMDVAHDRTFGRAEHLASEARDTALDIGESMIDTITRNPVPSALAALGLGWMLMGRRESSPSYSRSHRYERPYRREYVSDGETYGFWHGVSEYERDDEGMMERARERVEEFAEEAPVNPVPLALAALGVGWLVMEGRNSANRRIRSRGYAPNRRRYGRGAAAYDYEDGYGRSGYRDRAAQVAEEAGRYADRAKDRAEELADDARRTGQRAQERTEEMARDLTQDARRAGREVQERAGELVDEARSTARSAQHRLEDMGQEAQHYIDEYGRDVRRFARRAPGQMERLIEENPMMVGALALAVGAAIGGAIPTTRYEDEVLGPRRDEVMRRAERQAGQALRQAESKAHEVVEKVQHVAETAIESAQSEMKKQTGNQSVSEMVDQAKDTVRDAAENVKETAKQEARDQGLTK